MESRPLSENMYIQNFSNVSLSGYIQSIHKVLRSTHTATECRNEWTVTANEQLKYEDIVTQQAVAINVLAWMSDQKTHIYIDTQTLPSEMNEYKSMELT